MLNNLNKVNLICIAQTPKTYLDLLQWTLQFFNLNFCTIELF